MMSWFRDMSPKYTLEAKELDAAEAEGPDRVPPDPRPAAGIVLARDTADGPEVLLVRRRADVGFAAGAYVFPGGTLDDEDGDARWGRFLTMPPVEALEGAADPGGPPPMTFVVAALREAFEETGVLLTEGEAPSRFPELRKALVSDRTGFLEIVGELGIRLAGDRLVLCARWITPRSLMRRYDARFFLAEAPAGIEVDPELGELVEHVWIRPAAALERYFDEDFPMLFPTARTLGWLADFDADVATWMARFRARRVEPILPRLRRVEDGVVSVIPGEPGSEGPEDD
jgi:8-oxo-dGTP pyrophosphatase MutT (NUDIX family)